MVGFLPPGRCIYCLKNRCVRLFINLIINNLVSEGFWTVWLSYTLHWALFLVALEIILKLRWTLRFLETFAPNWCDQSILHPILWEHIMDFHHATNCTLMNKNYLTCSNYFCYAIFSQAAPGKILRTNVIKLAINFYYFQYEVINSRKKTHTKLLNKEL